MYSQIGVTALYRIRRIAFLAGPTGRDANMHYKEEGLHSILAQVLNLHVLDGKIVATGA